MTEAQARKVCQQAGAPLPAGMHAGNFEKVSNTKRKIVDGIAFRSTLEADCYTLLRSWERAGAIRNLVCQPKYLLQPKMRVDGKAVRAITYIADFSFLRNISHVMPTGHSWGYEPVVIDAKGFRMPVYQIKKKLFLAKFPHIRLEEWDKAKLKQEKSCLS